VKRIHEYTRQLLNVLGIIHRYDAIKKMTPEQRKTVGLRQMTCSFSCCGLLSFILPETKTRQMHNHLKRL